MQQTVDWRCNTIWFDKLAETEFISIDFREHPKGLARQLQQSYILTNRFKSRTANLEDFPADGTVKFLDLTWSNLHSFSGISRLGEIKRLETSYCLKLESDSGLSEVARSLEWLHINQSKKFTPSDDLFALSNLKVLCLNACAPLADLEFLYDFPNLLDFRFVDTNVISGDLTPLVQHPTLCSAGFLNKRHYNIKDVEVKQHLQARRNVAIEMVNNGHHQTFRYSGMDA